ncbi:MAG: hypothetical protein GYB68_08695 [Chloroflexi bacterium]|nr:hypothetical protein [Chloroflexota bacterium]
MASPFDPTFDDCAWTDAWLQVPIIQLTPGVHQTFSVKQWQVTEANICGQPYRFSAPIDVRGIVMHEDERLWMSDVPQERLMMFKNAARSRGRILVGGLGVGLYPQYAMALASRLHIVEVSSEVRHVVGPIVEIAAAAYQVDLTFTVDTIESVLEDDHSGPYDTIFLDVWDTINPLHLPWINGLRDQALQIVKPDGQVLLWGYGLMLRLFEDACRQLLSVTPSEREAYFDEVRTAQPGTLALLRPVLDHFAGEVVNLDEALPWCRDYAIKLTE